MGVLFHSDGVGFSISNPEKLNAWVVKCLSSFNKNCGEINVIFCNDDYLLSINKTYLNHDYYTDIITFDYSKAESVSGDLYVSVTRVKDNAKKLNLEFNDELYRVIVHGVLHLCGLKDKTKQEKEDMRAKEDEMLLLMS
tara:strand:+ start:926 stop:1342 length:417 start_codon:yes stop_codon:yes gene_type:complete